MTHRLYRYVGPPEIAHRWAEAPAGVIISSPDDVSRWLASGDAGTDFAIATFVVDEAGRLRLADRHSEHVACAGGAPVRAAGEMTVEVAGSVRILAVSNQSTGYCPEPESWPAVVEALARAGLSAPGGYEPALVFRRCPGCDRINIVKDGVFECAVCDEALPERWNL